MYNYTRFDACKSYRSSLSHSSTNTYPLWSIKHVLQMDDPGMTEVLEDRHLRSQLALVLVRKPQLVDDLHCHWFSSVSVLACMGAEEGGSLSTQHNILLHKIKKIKKWREKEREREKGDENQQRKSPCLHRLFQTDQIPGSPREIPAEVA